MPHLLRRFTFLALTLMILTIPAIASAAPQNNSTQSELLVRQIMGAVYEGKTLSSIPYGVGDSLKKDVEKNWGPAEDKSTVVANYWSRNVSFFYDRSTRKQIITGIHDYDPQISVLTYQELKKQIKKTLYKDPIAEREVEGQYEVTYKANNTHNVIFLFDSKFINPDPTLRGYLLQPK